MQPWGRRVIQIGCDPKADSTINLLGGEPLRPVMNYMREEDEEPEKLEDISKEGFGGVLMLIVAPGCCGRNTSMISSMPQYEDRFFYLTMDETDIVTGRHLKKVPKAVQEICDSLEKKPSVVMICITCVDALLGTDMERICRKSEEKTGLPVRPCYMYALTREGRKPPMVHVRQSLYSLLEPKTEKRKCRESAGIFLTTYG